MSNLRDKILSAPDIKSEHIFVPEWDVTLEIKGLNGRQRAVLLQETTDKKGNVDMAKLYPQLVIMSTYDPETSEPVFLTGDMDAVSEKSSAAIERLAGVAMKLSGLDPEETRKN